MQPSLVESDWRAMVQTLYYAIAIVVALAALVVYWRNHRLEQSRWLSGLYDKFYEGGEYKRVRDLLDSESHDVIGKMVDEEDAAFTDYLNFFEHVALFVGSRQLNRKDVEASFGYYLNCLSTNLRVCNYIDDEKKGYEKLRAYLVSRK